jgi:molybdopterin converting factor small subunit
MRVHVKLYAGLGRAISDALPGTPIDVLLPDAATVCDLVGRLNLPRQEVKIAFVNGRSRPMDWPLAEGDEVGIFPLVGGG